MRLHRRTRVERRNNRGLVAPGGRSAFHTLWSGTDLTNPAINPLTRANGDAAWLGWPNDPVLEGLRDEWLATSHRPRAAGPRLRDGALRADRFGAAADGVSAGAERDILSPVHFFWNMEKR